MANATDNLVEAEKIIKNIIVGRVVTDKALEICRWLLSFNSQENHKIKCYQTGGKTPDIRFCIDRGSDCEHTNIMTGFLVIEPNHALMGLYSSSPRRYTYFKPDTNPRWRIGSRDVSELPIATIREHILESYCLKIKDLSLDSVVCRGIDNKLGRIAGEKIGATVASDIESLKAEEGSECYFEGGKKKCLVNLYERNPKLRTNAISFHGKKCKVCSFDFGQFYGEHGYNYIEVHHLRPVSSLNGKEKVNPASDMTVLCSNCHRMIHRFRDNVLSPEELKNLINRQ